MNTSKRKKLLVRIVMLAFATSVMGAGCTRKDNKLTDYTTDKQREAAKAQKEAGEAAKKKNEDKSKTQESTESQFLVKKCLSTLDQSILKDVAWLALQQQIYDLEGIEAITDDQSDDAQSGEEAGEEIAQENNTEASESKPTKVDRIAGICALRGESLEVVEEKLEDKDSWPCQIGQKPVLTLTSGFSFSICDKVSAE